MAAGGTSGFPNSSPYLRVGAMGITDGPHRFETVFRDFLLKVELVLASVFLVMMVGSIVLQVVARFAFQTGLAWTDEVAIFSFVWASLVGAAMVIETRNAHLIDYFVKKCPEGLQRAVNGGVFLLLVVIAAVLVVYGFDMTKIVHNQISSVLNLRMSFVYVALPFSAALMLVSILLDWRQYVRIEKE
jgi:TRAP-type transport system small permease protein